MKTVITFILVCLISTLAAGQSLTIKTSFATGGSPSEGQTIPSTFSDSLRQVPGLTGSYTASPLLTASGHAKPSSAGTGNNIMNLAYWFQKYLGTKSSTYLGVSMQIATAMGSTDNGSVYTGTQGIFGNALYMMNDTAWATADGVMGQVVAFTATQAHFRIHHVINGAATMQTEVNAAYAVGDTIKLVWISTDSLVMYKNSTWITGRNFATAGHPELSPAQVPNYFCMLGTSKQSTMAEVDNFAIGYTNAPAAPPAANVPPTVVSITIFPNGVAGGDTNTVFSFNTLVTDDTGSTKIAFDLDGAAYDSVSQAANPSVSFTSKSTKITTTGVHTIRVRAYDGGGGVTTTSTTSFNVSLPSVSSTGFTGFVVGYYQNWWMGQMNPEDMDFNGMTHIIQFYSDPDPNGVAPYFRPVNSATDSSAMEWSTTAQGFKRPNAQYSESYQHALIRLAHAAGTKTLFCVGGIYGTGASLMATLAADSVKTQAWSNSVIAYCVRKGFDGIDLDWEFPNSATNFARLCRIVRRGLNTMTPAGIFTIAVPSSFTGGGFDIAAMNANIDLVNVMDYDMWNNNTSVTGFNSPLAKSGTLPGNSWRDHSALNWFAAGIPKAKLADGIPFYDEDFANISVIGQAYSSYSQLYYKTAIAALASGGVYHWDDSAKAPWVSYVSGGVNRVASYEDTNSVKYKMQRIKDDGIGGLMIYGLGDGWVPTAPAGQRDPLWRAVKSQLTSSSPPVIPIAPTSLTAPTANATNVNHSAPIFTWGSVSGAGLYRLQLSTNTPFTSIVVTVSGMTSTTYTYSGAPLSFGTVYYWHVAAGDAFGNYGSYSTLQSFTTENISLTTPATPVLLVPAANATGQAVNVTMRWNANTDSSTGYVLQLLAVDTLNSNYVVNTQIIPDTFVTVSNLQYSTDYFWRVKATKGASVSGGYNGYRKFTTISAPAPSPTTSTVKQSYVKYPGGRTGYQTLEGVNVQDLTSLNPLSVPDTLTATLAVINGELGIVSRTRPWKFVGGSTGNINGPLSVGGDVTIQGSSVVYGDFTLGGNLIGGAATQATLSNVRATSAILNSLIVSGANAGIDFGGVTQTGIYADRVGNLTLPQVIDSARSMAGRMALSTGFFDELSTVVGVVNWTTTDELYEAGAIGSEPWSPKPIGGGTTLFGLYGNPSWVVADSNRIGLVFVQSDSNQQVAPTVGKGMMFTLQGNSGMGGTNGRNYCSAYPNGFTFAMGVKTSTVADSLVFACGLIGYDANGTSVRGVNAPDTNGVQISFEIGKKSVNGIDSIYAVTADGTNKTRNGIMAAAATTWYRLEWTVYRTFVVFNVYTFSNNVATLAGTRTISTTLPAASTGANPYFEVINYDRSHWTKATTFDYIEFFNPHVVR